MAITDVTDSFWRGSAFGDYCQCFRNQDRESNMILCCWPLVIVSTVTLCCGQLAAQTKDWSTELEHGYQASSREPLDAFLDAWYSDSQPVTADTFRKKLPFEQDVYDIYYRLFAPDKEGYANTKYIIIQDEIAVVVVDSDLRAEFMAEPFDRHYKRMKNLVEVSRVVVKDFRPNVKDFGPRLKDKKVLYLQDKYLCRLVGFITQAKDPDMLLFGGRYHREENRSSERQKRLQYLNTALRIRPGSWTTGWIFGTHPEVSVVYLSANMKRAIVRYRIDSHHGEALLEKVAEEDWELLSMKIDRIE
jgi:hypothetical protein